jgi:hypothetical protein
MRIEFSQHDYETLLLTLGYAAGALQRSGEHGLFFRVLELANRINRDNPNWTAYELPPRELWDQDNEEIARYFFQQVEREFQAYLNMLLAEKVQSGEIR